MILFIISIVMLIIAYYIYDKSFENAIGTKFIRMKMVQVCTKKYWGIVLLEAVWIERSFF
jgi:predicted cation transporter